VLLLLLLLLVVVVVLMVVVVMVVWRTTPATSPTRRPRCSVCTTTWMINTPAATRLTVLASLTP